MDINGFLSSLQTKSDETLRAYRRDVERFQAFMKSKSIRIDQVKTRHITEFIDYLSANRGHTADEILAPATVARRLAVLSSFFDYYRNNVNDRFRNPLDLVKRPKVRNEMPRAVNDEVLQKLVEGIDDPRDKAIVLLFLYSGLRLREVNRCDKQTISVRSRNMPDGSVQLVGVGEIVGKGAKRRLFLVGLKAVEAIAEYLQKCRQEDTEPALFLSNRRRRLSCRALQQIVDKWCRRLGIEHVHVHQLRHSFATRNVNAGMSSAVLRELMGHASLTTTQRYFQVKEERLSREYFSVMEFLKQTGAA